MDRKKHLIGEEFGSHVVEAHHIDYFVTSLNNDASNQMVVCPNHLVRTTSDNRCESING